MGIYAEPGDSCFENERFQTKRFSVETNLVIDKKDELIPEELVNFFITLAVVSFSTLAL